ncbi:hypothetical protein WBG99_27965 [Streptomyces sp. TG1A-60]
MTSMWCPRSSETDCGSFDGLGAGRRGLEPVRVVETPLATHPKYRFVK